MATGLLLVLLGAATKLEPWLVKHEKTYQGVIQLGLSTDTDDVTGGELVRHHGPWPDRQEIESALASFVGSGPQVPPAYCALKVGGRSAHRAARSGEPLDIPARMVTAHGLTCLDWDPPNLSFWASVSSGYYIRSLARDLGCRLSLGGGALAALRRLTVGRFSLEQAAGLPADGLQLKARLFSPRQALEPLKEVELGSLEAGRFCSGGFLPVPPEVQNYSGPGPLKVIGPNGTLIALAEISGLPDRAVPGQPQGPFLRPLRVFRPEEI
jgi:tRNA pseudouridine55 synthase